MGKEKGIPSLKMVSGKRIHKGIIEVMGKVKE